MQPSEQHAITLANDLTTAPEMLEYLAGVDRGESIRRIVASNPNTPPDLLMQLVEDFPWEVTENPAFTLMKLENPQFIAEMGRETLGKILKHPKIPPIFIDAAIENGHPYFLNDLLKIDQLTSAQLCQLFPCITDDLDLYATNDIDIARKFLNHPNFPDTLLKPIVNDKWSPFHIPLMEWCFRQPELPIKLLQELLAHGDDDLHSRMLAGENMPEDLVMETLHGIFLHHQLGFAKSLEIEVFYMEINDGEEWNTVLLSPLVLKCLAKTQVPDINLRIQIRSTLARTLHKRISYHASGKPPENDAEHRYKFHKEHVEILDRLAEDEYEPVRQIVAKLPKIPKVWWVRPYR